MSTCFKKIPTENLLIKHFFILGIDSDKILDSKYFENIKNISDSHKLKPSVLSLFPSFPKNNIYIDENILLRHCFPNGFYLKQYNKFPLPEHFCFELSNFPLNSHQSKLYFTCLSFHEPIENYNLFKTTYDKGIEYSHKLLQTQNKSKDNNNANNNSLYKEISSTCRLLGGYYIEKVIGFITVDYHPKVLAKILYLLHGRYTGHFNEIEEPLEKIIESLIFRIPSVKLGKSKLEILLFKKQHYIEYPPINSVPLLSIEINKIFERYKIEESLQIFKSILLEEPILLFSKNKTELTATFDAFLSLLYPFTYVQPHCGILPNNSFGLIESCDGFIFGINQEYNNDFFKNNEISVFNKRIIILDLDNKKKFKYHQLDVIQIDLDHDLEEDEFLLGEENLEKNDENKNGKSQYDKNNNYKNYRNFNEQNLLFEQSKEEEIDLPSHYKKKTINFIMDYLKVLAKNQNQTGRTVEKDNFNQKIKEQFLYFIVSIMIDYYNYIKYNYELLDKYLLHPEIDINIEKLFDIDGFINNSHKVDELFYRKFFHTKIFKNFIIKKIYPISLKDKIDVLYFDERIADKKNKSIFENKLNTPFIYYEFNSNDYRIIINSQYFSLDEINYLRNEKNKKTNFNYYQIIISNRANNGITIKYPVFPKLLYDDYFFNKPYSELYIINKVPIINMVPINLNLREINNLIKNKEFSSVYNHINYTLNNYDNSKLLRIEQKTLLPCIWLALYALTFNYCYNLDEKRIRYADIIEKLYTIDYLDVDVFSLILIVIGKYGTNEELLMTFGRLRKNKILLNDYTLHSYVITSLSKNFNSDMTASRTNTMSSRSAILNKRDNKDKDTINLNYNNLLKRGIYTNNINKQESIDFGLKSMCPYCRVLNQINYSIIMKQEGEVHGVLLQCGNCQKSFSPRIKVNINEEIIETFELMSCYDMLEFIKSEFMTNKTYSIDVKNFHYDYPNLFWNAIFYFSVNELNFDFLTAYVKDIPETRINSAKNKTNLQSQDLYSENCSNISYCDVNLKGNLSSNYKNPFIKMNSGRK